MQITRSASLGPGRGFLWWGNIMKIWALVEAGPTNSCGDRRFSQTPLRRKGNQLSNHETQFGKNEVEVACHKPSGEMRWGRPCLVRGIIGFPVCYYRIMESEGCMVTYKNSECIVCKTLHIVCSSGGLSRRRELQTHFWSLRAVALQIRQRRA